RRAHRPAAATRTFEPFILLERAELSRLLGNDEMHRRHLGEARRLFERLHALGAVRELTGRTAFRLYGL
ncbi:MAG: DUF1403 family protein, partial [Bacteroidales bacterium]|nr:DUF1403 family protein [Bacteroidales bacterium]